MYLPGLGWSGIQERRMQVFGPAYLYSSCGVTHIPLTLDTTLSQWVGFQAKSKIEGTRMCCAQSVRDRGLAGGNMWGFLPTLGISNQVMVLPQECGGHTKQIQRI